MRNISCRSAASISASAPKRQPQKKQKHATPPESEPEIETDGDVRETRKKHTPPQTSEKRARESSSSSSGSHVWERRERGLISKLKEAVLPDLKDYMRAQSSFASAPSVSSSDIITSFCPAIPSGSSSPSISSTKAISPIIRISGINSIKNQYTGHRASSYMPEADRTSIDGGHTRRSLQIQIDPHELIDMESFWRSMVGIHATELPTGSAFPNQDNQDIQIDVPAQEVGVDSDEEIDNPPRRVKKQSAALHTPYVSTMPTPIKAAARNAYINWRKKRPTPFVCTLATNFELDHAFFDRVENVKSVMDVTLQLQKEWRKTADQPYSGHWRGEHVNVYWWSPLSSMVQMVQGARPWWDAKQVGARRQQNSRTSTEVTDKVDEASLALCCGICSVPGSTGQYRTEPLVNLSGVAGLASDMQEMRQGLNLKWSDQDYVATRWYRAPELCGSFVSKGGLYTIESLEVDICILQSTHLLLIFGASAVSLPNTDPLTLKLMPRPFKILRGPQNSFRDR
ncbi:MAP kinase 15 [Perilla frutescens var. frutescens]|nr:MAP kinase 15 [Perilla frutescens var. frutescens]